MHNHITYEEADHRHPVDLIEPLDDETMDTRAVVLCRLLDTVFPSPKSTLPQGERFEVAFRKFVAICMCVRPELFDGQSQITIGKFLGCSSANISKMLTGLSDQLGIRPPSAETDEARAAKSAAQLNRTAATNHGLTAEAKHQRSVDHAVVQAKKKMQTGRPWTKFEVVALSERGLIDDERAMTEAGRAFFGVAAADA